MAQTKSNRVRTVPVTAPGLSLEDAVAQIQESFSAPAEAQELNVSQPSDSATPVVAAPASEPAKEPVRAPESPRPVVTEAEPKPSIRPGLYRLDAEGYAEPVPEEDALKFERLNADYTTKTQALADQRRQFDAEQAALKAERESLAQEKLRTAAALRQALPVEPDWNQVYANDPQNFAATYAAYKIRQDQAEKVEREALALQQKTQAERQTSERARMLELIPEWKDPAVAHREMVELSQYIANQGWDPQTMQAVVNDSRAVRLARTAMLAERRQVSDPERRAQAQIKIDRVKVASPGAASAPKPPPSKFDQDMNRLKRSGKVQDAYAVFDQLLGNK